MDNRAIVGVLLVAVLALCVAVGWMWNERQKDDIRIDLPQIHLKK